MDKICTSIEQSKKLVELGIDVNTADMYYDVNSYGIQSKPEVLVGKVWKKDIPAWSLSKLLTLLPDVILHEERNWYIYFDKKTNKNNCTRYNISYFSVEDSNDDIVIIRDSFVDACHEMILELKKQNML